MNIKFTYKGLSFEIIGTELFCDGVTVALVTANTALLDIKTECDKYINFLAIK